MMLRSDQTGLLSHRVVHLTMEANSSPITHLVLSIGTVHIKSHAIDGKKAAKVYMLLICIVHI